MYEYDVFTEMENFNATRKCIESEHECTNTYGYKICVKEEVKYVACAEYSTVLCDDDKFLRQNEFTTYSLVVTLFQVL